MIVSTDGLLYADHLSLSHTHKHRHTQSKKIKIKTNVSILELPALRKSPVYKL